MSNKKVIFKDLGIVDYAETWDFQEALLQSVAGVKTYNRKNPQDEKQTSNYLLFCEHPHVYTLGKSGDQNNLLLDEKGLEEQEAVFYKNNRGGDITYHGPGQIVGYPILDLENFKPDLHLYLRNLEEAAILTLDEYGLQGEKIPGLTGVWLGKESPGPRKVLAIGVRCSRWVTMHGFAFNVNTQLEYFDNIIPCGIDDKAVSSLSKELGIKVDMEEAKQKMLSNLAKTIGFEIIEGELPLKLPTSRA